MNIGRLWSAGNYANIRFTYADTNDVNNNFSIGIGGYDNNRYYFYRDRAIFTNNLIVPAITLNNVDLATTLNNCAKLDSANTFTGNIEATTFISNGNSDGAQFYNPNGDKYIRLGTNENNGNCCDLCWRWYNDGSVADNYFSILLYNGTSYDFCYKFYGNKAIFSQPLTVPSLKITTGVNDSSGILCLDCLNGKESSAIRLGYDNGYKNFGTISFEYAGDANSNNALCFSHSNDYLCKMFASYTLFQRPITVNGACTASSHPTSSDLRLKKNINKFTDEENIIDNINIYSFNLINEEPQRKHYGVIAQELQNIAPELVYEDKSDEKYLSVNYTELIPHLINKIHQQEKIISDLTEKMNKIYELLEIN